MHAHRHGPLITLALAGLVAGCNEPAGYGALTTPGFRPSADVVVLPSGPLHIQAEYGVETVDPETIRELLEITAHFTGLDASDPQRPVEDIELNFEPVEADYAPQEKGLRITIIGDTWAKLDGGDFFTIEATDPQALQEALKVELIESGQPVITLTHYVAGVDARLASADLDAWQLTLELTGIDLPSGIVTPSVLNTVTGSAVGTLVINQTELTTRVQATEASYTSAQLVLEPETKIQDEGPDEVREVFAVFATFASGELQPDPLIPAVEDIQVDFEVNFAGAVGPSCIQFVIPGDAWVQGDGGGFKLEHASGLNSPPIHVFVLDDGDVVAELTDHIEAVEAGLNFLVNQKRWELRVEIAGVVTSSDVHVAHFSALAGAGRVSVEIGEELGLLIAKIREAEGVFGIIIPMD